MSEATNEVCSSVMLDKELVTAQDVKKKTSSKSHSPVMVDEQLEASPVVRNKNIKVVRFFLLKVL